MRETVFSSDLTKTMMVNHTINCEAMLAEDNTIQFHESSLFFKREKIFTVRSYLKFERN